MPIENVRMSQTGRDQLLVLKRRTHIENWNVLCRWAYCLSLAESSHPRNQPIPSDSSVEMTWRTFGGKEDGIYAALAEAATEGEQNPDKIPEGDFFRLHLHRGVGYLAGDPNVKSITGLIKLALDRDPNQKDA